MRHILTFLGGIAIFACLLLGISCTDKHEDAVADRLNELSYANHYRNLSLARQYALQALEASKDGDPAEAYNNLAFVSITKMDYPKAEEYLKYAHGVTNNMVEQMIADVQLMRLCQRRSENKDFYIYMQRAQMLMKRIAEESDCLSEHQRRRFVYAQSEYSIVASTYFYYVGQSDHGVEMLEQINPSGEIVGDTAQLLNYYYNIGSGGILHEGTSDEICQAEFNYLLHCYLLSRQYNYPFWEANSLQSLSEHLQDAHSRQMLMKNNHQEIDFINVDNMPDSLLAGNLAFRSLTIFARFGDVYQTAGSYRTLAQCYFNLRDYQSALICLDRALTKNKAVNRAPDLVASIREKLSLAYSAVDDKQKSDYNRNIYLDLQEVTRQDRSLEARADQLNHSSLQLNAMISAVVLLILLAVFSLFWVDRQRRKNRNKISKSDLLSPLMKWKEEKEQECRQDAVETEEISERINLVSMQLADYKKTNIEQRAKVSLVNSITPLINRIVNEARMLMVGNVRGEERAQRYEYMVELSQKINEYNNALTQWVKMRKGELSLRIESFALQPLFDIIAKGKTEFQSKGINLEIAPTSDVIKADKALTLFMINTIVDNARKCTQAGGSVRVSSYSTDKYVEVSVVDTGRGMTEEDVANLFKNKVITDNDGMLVSGASAVTSHGFGLMNCKGIIEKYKKTSSFFNVCEIGAESELGKGTRLHFRLPKGIVRNCMIVICLIFSAVSAVAAPVENYYMLKAGEFADSAYFCNVAGNYRRALEYADSCCQCFNKLYLQKCPAGKELMVGKGGEPSKAAELMWFQQKLKFNYNVLLDIRNESAVAALAMHDWETYNYNNKVYTQLFRECSADDTLADYVKVMQRAETNKNIAIVMLVMLLIMIFPAYYFFYYRHRMEYRYAVDRISSINDVLLSDSSSELKLNAIRHIWEKEMISNRQELQPLSEVVDQIEQTLEQEILNSSRRQNERDLLTDELQRVEYEKDQLHISNSVLDNCLSTIKHETMYYPSRIMQLVDGTDRNLPTIHELALYYQTLYSMLSEQATRQIHLSRIDYSLTDFLFSLLTKVVNAKSLDIVANNIDDRYVRVSAVLPTLSLTDQQLNELFTPSTIDFRFLVCRQIAREYGELTNARACGIVAERTPQGDIQINVVLTQRIWKNSKLS